MEDFLLSLDDILSLFGHVNWMLVGGESLGRDEMTWNEVPQKSTYRRYSRCRSIYWWFVASSSIGEGCSVRSSDVSEQRNSDSLATGK